MKNELKKVTDRDNKMVDESIELGVRVQDQMAEMSQQQLEAFRTHCEFVLKQQEELFTQFEKNAKQARSLWIDGLHSWQKNFKSLIDIAQ